MNYLKFYYLSCSNISICANPFQFPNLDSRGIKYVNAGEVKEIVSARKD